MAQGSGMIMNRTRLSSGFGRLVSRVGCLDAASSGIFLTGS